MTSFYSEAAEALSSHATYPSSHTSHHGARTNPFFLLSDMGRMEAQNKIHVLHTDVYRYMYA